MQEKGVSIPASAFPGPAQNRLFYLMGRKYYERGELSKAAQYFERVSDQSDLYMRAKYFEGVIHADRSKYRSAVAAFKDVIRHPAEPKTTRQLQEMEDLRELSLINIARIYYGLARFDTAADFYEQVDRASGYWAESLFERSWAEFMQNDYNATLGLLLTVRSPYYRTAEYIPEATILRSLTFFSLCNFAQTEALLLDFEEQYKPVQTELKTSSTSTTTRRPASSRIRPSSTTSGRRRTPPRSTPPSSPACCATGISPPSSTTWI